MKKLTAALVICCFLFLKVKSQTGKNEILLNILKGQKAYLNNNIKENEKPKYLSLLYFASVIHPKVTDEFVPGGGGVLTTYDLYQLNTAIMNKTFEMTPVDEREDLLNSYGTSL